MKKIMLLEDDEALSAGILMALGSENYEFMPCFTIAEAKIAIHRQTFDLLILDINLPDGSGVELCREIRKESQIPILMLTARDLELDIVVGLESGGDDYLTKPFSLAVLRARINALCRRLEPSKQSDSYTLGAFSFHFMTMEFLKNGIPIELSKTEQKLLYLFVMNQNIILTREVIMERIWSDGAKYVDDNALSVTMKRLRDKLEDNPSKPEYMKTIYGLGYTWANKEKDSIRKNDKYENTNHSIS